MTEKTSPVCPPECKVELDHIQDELKEINETMATQWEEINKRAKMGSLFWAAGITIAVLGSLLGLIYSQAQQTHQDVIGLMVQAERIETQLKGHMENTRDSFDRARNDKDGG